MFNMVLNGLQCSQMVIHGLNIDHKFIRMAFITRFNLVLVWSKIVQIFTNKSSKWVRHNQVSWSSLNIIGYAFCCCCRYQITKFVLSLLVLRCNFERAMVRCIVPKCWKIQGQLFLVLLY